MNITFREPQSEEKRFGDCSTLESGNESGVRPVTSINTMQTVFAPCSGDEGPSVGDDQPKLALLRRTLLPEGSRLGGNSQLAYESAEGSEVLLTASQVADRMAADR